MHVHRLSKTAAAVGLSLAVAFSGLPFLPDSIVPEAQAYSVSKANKILETGKKYMGKPYKFGAPSGSTRIFDCSSFTQYVYGKNGIDLPRTSKKQSKKGSYVAKKNLRKGDLVFFSTSSSKGKVAHVAIYAGNGKILHTYGKPGVTYSDLNSKWWKSHYITARRVIK